MESWLGVERFKPVTSLHVILSTRSEAVGRMLHCRKSNSEQMPSSRRCLLGRPAKLLVAVLFYATQLVSFELSRLDFMYGLSVYTATDVETGEPFVFDDSAMYAHNEYELGNWRIPRHRLSSKAYIRNYKKHFPASEPGDSGSKSEIHRWKENPLRFLAIISEHLRFPVEFQDFSVILRSYVQEANHIPRPSLGSHAKNSQRLGLAQFVVLHSLQRMCCNSHTRKQLPRRVGCPIL